MRRWLAVLAALTFFGACTHRPPKPPEPPPTPPPVAGTPAKGTPQGPERLLRIVDGPRLQTNDGRPFDAFMAVPCCMGWAKCPNQRWPGFSECFADETAKYGANMFHFRIGPWFGDEDNESEWKDIGGAYLPGTSEWNDVFWVKVRDLVWHAYQAGAYIEVVPIDDWWLKGACGRDAGCGKKVPWLDVDVKAWGKTPTPEARRLYYKTVEEVGCFGNVIWATGNEEDLIPGMTAEHVNWRIQTIRDAEQQVGCSFVHLIGTGSWKDGIQADYSITHETSPVTGPCNSRFCVNNEHNPEFSPEQEASYFKQARDAKQVWAAWRAGAEDPEWEKRLQLFQEVIRGALPVECYPPPDDEQLWTMLDPQGADRADEVKAVQAEIGSMCKEPKDHRNGLDAIDELNTRLRRHGYCAGVVGSADAVMILSERQDGNGTLWEEHHAVAPFDTGCWSTSNAHYPLHRWRYTGQWKPPAPPGVCGNPDPPPISKWNVKEHVKGPNWTTVDATPLVCDMAYCAAVGFTDNRSCCSVRQEGDPLRSICETAVVGVPQWTAPAGWQPDPSGNPYMIRVPRGTSGPATVCTGSGIQPQVCGTIQVTQ